jgi:endonuclease/exonuclease/phosphatase family metal-dependent hydrolase
VKKNIAIISSLLFLSVHLIGQELKLMTYNIKYDNTNDTVNNWNDRKTSMVDLIAHYNPQIFGTQEAMHHQTMYLDNSLTNYSFIGVGRDDGKQKGEYSAIHYDHTKFKVLKSNTFWLSETPEKISVGWDASMERICTYGLFQNIKTHRKFYVFNTHFDHRGTKAREESAKLIFEKITKINSDKLPVVLMGDLNLMPEQKPIQFLKSKMDDGQDITSKGFYGPTGTFNGFNRDMLLNRRIDYIFTKGFTVQSYVHIDDRMENNKHISDHLPVLITLD